MTTQSGAWHYWDSARTGWPDDSNNNNNNNNNINNRIQRCNSRFLSVRGGEGLRHSEEIVKWPKRNRVQITSNTSSAYHVQHVVLRAVWHEGTAQLLSLTDFKSHLYEFYFIG